MCTIAVYPGLKSIVRFNISLCRLCVIRIPFAHRYAVASSSTHKSVITRFCAPPALASFIYRVYFGKGSDLSQITLMKGIGIPVLKDIPFIGPLLFNQTPMVYIAFILVILTSIFFRKTRAGLNYRAVGENPKAAATLGIRVISVKYLACAVCGALAGVGGAYLTTCYSNTYTEGNIAGRGFIALAAVIFGRWSASGILIACLFFGFCDALQIRLQVASVNIPYQFFQMIPYVATVIALSIIGSRQLGPKAAGKPYRKEEL